MKETKNVSERKSCKKNYRFYSKKEKGVPSIINYIKLHVSDFVEIVYKINIFVFVLHRLFALPILISTKIWFYNHK